MKPGRWWVLFLALCLIPVQACRDAAAQPNVSLAGVQFAGDSVRIIVGYRLPKDVNGNPDSVIITAQHATAPTNARRLAHRYTGGNVTLGSAVGVDTIRIANGRTAGQTTSGTICVGVVRRGLASTLPCLTWGPLNVPDVAPPAPDSLWFPSPVVLGLAQRVDSETVIPVWIQRPQYAGQHVAVVMQIIPTTQQRPAMGPSSPSYLAMLAADTLPSVAYPSGLGPRCVWGAAGVTQWDTIPGGCVRTNLATDTLTRAFLVRFEAIQPGTGKLITACALTWIGATPPRSMQVELGMTGQGGSCTAPYWYIASV